MSRGTDSRAIGAVIAMMRIDRLIEPTTVFVPASAEQREELLQLSAVRELSEAEAALAEKIAIPTYSEIKK